MRAGFTGAAKKRKILIFLTRGKGRSTSYAVRRRQSVLEKKGPCTFPLTPHIDDNEVLSLVWNDTALPYECPLIEEEFPLDPKFIQATYTCWKHLIRDPLIYDLVKQDSKDRDLEE